MHFLYHHLDPDSLKAKQSAFDTLFDLFQQLVSISGGDVSQALRWLTELDKEYGITQDLDTPMSMGEFIEQLQERGFIKLDEERQVMVPTSKTGQSIRKRALEEIFRSLKKGMPGAHKTAYSGRGAERQPETRPWNPGEELHQIDPNGTLKNMLRHSSLDSMELREDDLEVFEQDFQTATATVLLIDLSHSMILYGEDRITPAKKVAMALSELISQNYSKDTLDIVVFGNEAWKIEPSELPYLKVGPFHTNTLHGLQVARHLLERKRFANRQIFMITDGKPSCMFEGDRLYKNSYGLDRKIVNRVLDEAVACRRSKIEITTFMIARDPYLQNFVRDLTEANKGRAYYADLNHLGGYVFEDFVRNRKKRMK
jgi:uncharacterized protein with von Willebrand factor type A (vWA) domain